MEMNELRSENSESLYLRFINRCDKSVDIIWINFKGQYHVYGTLKPLEFLDVNTFTRHFWVFQETQSHRPLVADNNFCFCGEKSGYPPYGPNSRKRYVVYVSHPVVKELRSICINFLCNGKNALKQCADVKYLDIPVTLKREIIKIIHNRDSHSHVTPADRQKCENNLINWPD